MRQGSSDALHLLIMKLIEFKPPTGVVPEGVEEGSTFEEVSTYQVKGKGTICLVAIGDVQMPGYGHRNYEKEIGDRATARYKQKMGEA